MNSSRALQQLAVQDLVGRADAAPAVGSRPPKQVADAMHAAWVAFATAGDPGWAPYGADRPVMRFGAARGAGSVVEHDPRGSLRALWDGVR